MSVSSFIGNYQHNIDAKGRLFIPAKQREMLGERIYMTRGLDKCVFVFSEEGWENFINGLTELSVAKAREAQRYFGGNAALSDIDAQGRINVPQNLRKFAGLEKSVTVVGVFGRLELWDTEKWNSFNDEIDEDSVSGMLEELGF